MKRYLLAVAVLLLLAHVSFAAEAQGQPVTIEPTIGSFFDVLESGEQVNDPLGMRYGFWQDFTEGCSVCCAVESHWNSISASSFLPKQGSHSYLPCNAIDGDRNTVWVEGAAGYGVGEYLDYSCGFNKSGEDRQFDFLTLCIVNGYAENERKWSSNSRVKALELSVNGESVAFLPLKDTMEPQYFDISTLGISAMSGEATSFRFRIAEVYPGDVYDDTCITGIAIEFWTPNH